MMPAADNTDPVPDFQDISTVDDLSVLWFSYDEPRRMQHIEDRQAFAK